MKKMWIFIISSILILVLIILYSRYIGTSGLKIKEYKIINEDLTDNFYGLKIAHISDIHYGRVINKYNIKTIVDKINLTKPDLVVLTGDLIDKDVTLTIEEKEILITNLKNINATLGKYAIMGNHDYKFTDFNSIITSGNFIDLDDDYALIFKDTNTPILLAGMSTNLRNKASLTDKMSKVNKYFDDIKNGIVVDKDIPTYKILLMHEPDYIDKINYNDFNLLLAGHSHNGQVRLPLIGPILLPIGSKNYFDEYYKINNTDLYISSGIGTSALNLRLFNKPSFNLYRITNK